MALTESQQVSISKILNIPPYVLTAQLNFMGLRLTDVRIASIAADITAWESSIGDKFTRLMPTESNKGVKTDPSAARNNIQNQIAILLERPDWASGSNSGYLERG